MKLFKFLIHDVEIKFSNFCLRKFEEVESFLGSNKTSDGLDRVNISDTFTLSGEN